MLINGDLKKQKDIIYKYILSLEIIDKNYSIE